MELDDELYAQITKHSDIGEHYFVEGKFRKALEEYKKAFELIPEPKTDWDASVWTLAAIGDSHFMLKEFVSALEYFEKLMTEYQEEENPFIRVRYGECLYETGKTDLGKEHMLAAFKMEGTEVFDSDKYLKLISDLIWPMLDKDIIETNEKYWNEHADQWFGTTALPKYGVRFPTEDDLHLFGDVRGKSMLEICCGSGHSLLYNANKGAKELWGVDLSQKQLETASKLLSDNGYSAKLLCAKMEDELDVPKEYFDYVYSIYGIGWTTDLQGTFDKIASYLKKDGIFIFSWHHTLNYCIAWSSDERMDVIEDDDKFCMTKSYFDDSYFKMVVHGSEIVLSNRKISTYINALAKAGFLIEQFVEESSKEAMESENDPDPKTRKAKMLPISFCIKARKL